MPEEALNSSDKANITVAKVAGTPSATSWAQAYNAGKLYAVISLEETEDGENLPPLASVGKQVLERLQKEFFSLETKDLSSIKMAVKETIKEIPEKIKTSLVVGSISGNVFYIFIVGAGEVFIKRGEKTGILLSSEAAGEIKEASGFLEDGDIIFLKTDKFKEIIPNNTLFSSPEQNDVEDIAESITPRVHEQTELNGAAACLMLSFRKDTEKIEDINTSPIYEEEKKEEVQQATINEEAKKRTLLLPGIDAFFSPFKNRFKIRGIRGGRGRKTIFIAAVVLIIILIFSIFLSIKKNNDTKTKALFAGVYKSASEKYDEGKSLKDLNENLAKDDFSQAKTILDQNKDKFPKNSSEEKQIASLLQKVNSELSAPTPTPNPTLDRGKLTVSVQNGSGVTGAAAKASDMLKKLGYNITATGNADKEDYQNLKIQVKTGKKDYLPLLKSDLSKSYTVGVASSDLAESSPTDAVVIIGK